MVSIKRDQSLLKKAIKKLIKKKQNVQVKTIIKDANISALADYRGSTLLHLAIFYNNTELVEYCIDAGCNVDAQDIFKNTPLMIAITKRNYALCKCLINANADIFLSNQENKCPLFMILKDLINVPLEVYARFIEVMESSGRVEDIAEIFIRSKCKLNVIVSMKNAEWTKAVLERLETIEEAESLDSVQQALDLMDVPNLKVLLHYGHNVRSRIDYFFEKLTEFTKNSNLEVVDTLIENVVNWNVWLPDLRGTPVRVMGRLFETADEAAIKVFMKHQLHLRIKQTHDIDLMAHCGGNPNPGVIELLRQYMREIGKIPLVGTRKCSALYFAVQKGVMENIHAYLLFDMDPNLKDISGRTPLFYACCAASDVEIEKRKEIVFKLLYYRHVHTEYFDIYNKSILDSYDPESDWPVIQIILQYLAHVECSGPLTEPIRTIIISNIQLNEYYENCREQLKNMKKHEFCGTVSIYSLIMKPFTVTARSVRNNAAIELYDKENILKWDYYYRHCLCRHIEFIKETNILKNSIARILHECLGILRFNVLIITKIVDCFTFGDLREFRSLATDEQIETYVH